MSSVRLILVAIALCLAPAALSAQRVASERAGVVRPSLALRTHVVDTTKVDTIHVGSQRSRVYDATAGALIGVLAGLVVGDISATRAQRHCGDGPCMAGLAIPFIGGIGLVTGAVIGALWPTH